MMGLDVTSGCESREDFVRSLSALIEIAKKATLLVLETSRHKPSEITLKALLTCLSADTVHDIQFDFTQDPVAEEYFVLDERGRRRILVLRPRSVLADDAIGAIAREAATRLFDVFTAWESPAEPDYKFGDVILFQQGAGARRYLADGWSWLESEFVWSIGEVSKLVLLVHDIPDTLEQIEFRMTVRPLIVPGRIERQRLTLKVNGELLFEGAIAEPESVSFSFARAVLSDDSRVVVEIGHPDGARPVDVLPNLPDRRHIAIALSSLQLSS
jgi:hypothetical protein